MFMKTAIAFLATSALAAGLARHLSRKHQLRRDRADRQRQQDEVNRWESEGGNLPVKPQR